MWGVHRDVGMRALGAVIGGKGVQCHLGLGGGGGGEVSGSISGWNVHPAMIMLAKGG